MVKKTRMYVLLIMNFLFIIVAIYSFAYVDGNVRHNSNKKYGMSYNSRHYLSQTEHVSTTDFFTNIKGIDATIIAEWHDNRVGIYDPMFFYFEQNSIQYKSLYRYFSKDDYKYKRRVGVKIVDSFEEVADIAKCKSVSSVGIDDVLFCVSRDSVLGQATTTNTIMNLTSQDYIGHSVFINLAEKEQWDNMDRIMKSFGYREIKNQSPHSYFANVFQDITSNSRTFSFSLIFMISLVLSYFATQETITNEKRSIAIHFSHGGSSKKIIEHFSSRYLMMNALITAASFVLFTIFKPIIPFHAETSWVTGAVACFVVFAYTSLTYLARLTLQVTKVVGGKEDSNHVR